MDGITKGAEYAALGDTPLAGHHRCESAAELRSPCRR